MKIVDIFKERHYGVRIENDGKLEPIKAYLVDTSGVENCIINYSKEGLKEIKMNVKDKYFLKPNDIIIATVPSSTTAHVGFCSSCDEKVIIKKNFIILRDLKEGVNFNLEFIAEYLENFGIKEYYEDVKKSKEALTMVEVEDIDIPLIDIDKQNELMKAIHPINERSRLYNKLISNDNKIKEYLMNEVINNEE